MKDISKHPMLLFNAIKLKEKEINYTFQNILCYCLTHEDDGIIYI